MKVALIHLGNGLRGGLETRLHNYSKALLETGNQLTIYTAHNGVLSIQHPNLLIIRINLKQIPKVLRQYFFNRRLKQIFDYQKFDFALSFGRTTVTQHILASNTHKGFLNHSKKRLNWLDRLIIHLENASLQHAKTVYACSEMVKDELIHYYSLPEHKIKVLYPPLSFEQFSAQLNPSDILSKKMELGIDLKAEVFLFVSTGHNRKGLNFLMELFSNPINHNRLLLIAGKKVKTKMQNVINLGFVEEMESIYPIANALLHPAIYEPFGQVITEALFCGLPIIMSSNCGAKEVCIQDGMTIVLDLDLVQWQNAINAIGFADKKSHIDWIQFEIKNHLSQMMPQSEIVSTVV